MNAQEINALESLRQKWINNATFLEQLHGETETVKAIRLCQRDLFAFIEDKRQEAP